MRLPRESRALVPKIAHWMVRRRAMLFVAALAMLAGAAASVELPAFTGSLRGFDLRDNEFYATKQRADSLFGGGSTIYIIVTPTSTDTAQVIRDVKRLEARLRAALPLAQILSLSTYYDLAYGTTHPAGATDHFLTLASRIRVMRDLVAKDRTGFLVLARVPPDVTVDVAALTAVLDGTYDGIAPPTALSMFHVEEAIRTHIIRDFVVLTAGVVILLVGILLYIYRRLAAAAVAAVNVAIPVLASLFFFSAMDVDLNLVTVLVVPVVLILSLADSVHLLTGYAVSTSPTPEGRLTDVLSKYLVPSFYSSLTTAVAFFTFYLYSDAEFIRDFGRVTAAALMAEFALTFMVSPFLLHALDLRRLHGLQLSAGVEFLRVHQKAFAAAFLLTLIVAAIFVRDLRFSTSTRTFFPRGASITAAHDRFNQQYYSQVDTEILVEGTAAADAAEQLDAYIDQLAAALTADPAVTRVTSGRDRIRIGSFLPVSVPVGDLYDGANPYYHAATNTHRVVVTFQDPDLIEDFYTGTFARLRDDAPAGVSLAATSAFLLLDSVDEHVARSLLQSLLTAGVAIAFMILAMTRSVVLALLCLIPNLVPLAIVTLVFVVFEFPINILTAITAVVCLGLLDDDTVHILYRRIALRRPLDEVSFSILSTSVVLVAGFALFAVSSFRPIQTFGTISAIVFCFGVLSDLTMMPAIIDRWLPAHPVKEVET